MHRGMPKQARLVLDGKDFEGLLDVADGIPSARGNKTYYPFFDGTNWQCGGPDGPCKHFKYHGSECRHIKEMRARSLEELYKRICEKVSFNRDIRDLDCQEIEDVVHMMEAFKSDEMNKLATVFLNILAVKGVASTDDLHVATNEEYANNKIVGIVIRRLKDVGMIQLEAYKKTERRCAHSRPIGIYRLTQKGGKEIAGLSLGMIESGGN